MHRAETKWFLLRLESGDPAVNLHASGQPPEFDEWCWIDYFAPPSQVVHFKRKVYRQALDELAQLLPPDAVQRPVSPPQQHSATASADKQKAPSFARMRK